MNKTPINLQLDYADPGGPVNPLTYSKAEVEIHFPSLHYEGPVSLNLPQTGEMTVRYRVKSETTEVDPTGKHHYRCDIEISCIEKVKGDDHFTPPSKSGSESADALDKLMAEHDESDENSSMAEEGEEEEEDTKY